MATSAEDPNRDEDRLPWLETVEEDYREGPSFGRLLLLALIGIGVILAALFGYHAYQSHRLVAASGGGTGEMINAQEGDYKVKPEEPGGMKVSGEGESALATSAGTTGNASIDLKAVPEAPVTGTKAVTAKPGSNAKLVAVPASGGQLKVPTPAKVAAPAASASGGAVVQLGSFPSESGANAAWAAKSKRFAYLAPLGKAVQKAEVNGKTVYRLRVNTGSTGQAAELCGKLKVAGEACYVARD